MTTEQQDKLWNELSEEKKKEYRKEFQKESELHHENVKHCDIENKFEYNTGYSNGVISTLEDLFGEHNLNPEPPTPKTWEDVEKAEGGYISVDSKVINPNGRAWGLGLKYHQKAEATLKLAILIELGYGGMVSEEEWKDESLTKYYIKITSTGKMGYNTANNYTEKRFIAFHTAQQADEFMSHKSNMKLVEQFFMM